MNTSDLALVTGGIHTLRMWEFDPPARKVRPTSVSTSKEVRTYTCIAISHDDSMIYCGTTTGDVLVISAEKQTLLTQGPRKGACLGCGVQAICHIPSKDELLVGSGDGELITLDLAASDGQPKPKCVQKVLGAVSSVAMDSASEFFFVGTEKCNMYLVQLEGLVAELKTTCHAEHINDVYYAKNYSELFATCAGSDIRIWHSQGLSELLRVQVLRVGPAPCSKTRVMQPILSCRCPIASAIASPSSRQALTSSRAGMMAKYDPFYRRVGVSSM
jgi:WD40 repeat protein